MDNINNQRHYNTYYRIPVKVSQQLLLDLIRKVPVCLLSSPVFDKIRTIITYLNSNFNLMKKISENRFYFIQNPMLIRPFLSRPVCIILVILLPFYTLSLVLYSLFSISLFSFYICRMNVIITGASKGIGKAIARIYAAEGHTLLLCARNQKELAETAEELKKEYGHIVHIYPADLSNKETAISFGKWCLSLCVPDVLINNAGRFIPGSIYNEKEGTLEDMIETNLYSAYHVTRTIVSSMMAHQSGHIFNICSIASVKPYSNGGSYGISKFAMLGFSKNLREELMPFNIKVTAVLPGAVYTGSWDGSGVEPQRIMEDNDVAVMVFAASKLSPQACVEEIVMRPQLGDL